MFVPEVLAVGHGPETFRTYLRQQFAWASSLIQVLLTYTPRLVTRLSPAQAVQVLFTESWYPLWAVSLMILFLVPPLALLTGVYPSTVALPQFLAAWAPLSAVNWLFWLWSRRWQTQRQVMLSWRGVLLHVARWPIILWAFVNVLLGVKHPYMITPKGQRSDLAAFRITDQLLYLSCVWLSSLAVWLRLHDAAYPSAVEHFDALVLGPSALGLLSLTGASFMLAVYVANLVGDVVHLRRLGLGSLDVLGLRVVPFMVLLATVGIFGAAIAAL